MVFIGQLVRVQGTLLRWVLRFDKCCRSDGPVCISCMSSPSVYSFADGCCDLVVEMGQL